MVTRRKSAALDVAAVLPQHAARLSRMLWRHADDEISRTEAGVLSTLYDGPRRITDLAEIEGVAQPTMTVLAGKLEERGLVSRQRDTSDGRVVRVDITDEGRVALDRLRAQYRDVLGERMASMSSKEVAALRAATDALGGLIESLQQGRH